MNEPAPPNPRTPRSADQSRPFILGLAGGIGSGKSTVAASFAELGCQVFDFDHRTAIVLQRPEIAETLVGWWGQGVRRADGSLDRSAIGAIVFKDKQQRERLQGLIHPLVWRTASQARGGAPEGTPGIIFDAPLLYESGLDAECDEVVFVDTPEEARLIRVSESRGWSASELAQREASQDDLASKKGRCRFVIHNLGDKAGIGRQVGEVFAMMVGEEQTDEV